MEKYKICPVCGTKNSPAMLECIECENDLSSIRVTDDSHENEQETTISNNTSSDTQNMVRICEECGTKNPVQARKCTSCGEDISYIVPTPDTDEEQLHFVLSAIDGQYAYEIKEGKTVIGRENEMSDYLKNKSFVSRLHAEFLLENGTLLIKNHSNTNFTFVNNQKIAGSEFVALKDGDTIGLGGNEKNGSRQAEAAYFTVRIGSCI